MDDSRHVDIASSDAAVGEELGNTGVIAELGTLGIGAVINDEGVARLFSRHPASVKRAVERGELPPPCKMFGRDTWTVGVLIRHIEDRLAHASKERERLSRKIARLNP